MATTWLVCVVCTPATLALARPARLLCTPRPMRLAGVWCAAGRSAVPAAFSDALTTLRVAIHLIRFVLPPVLSARRHHATHGLPRKGRVHVLPAETLWDLAEKLDRHRIITSLNSATRFSCAAGYCESFHECGAHGHATQLAWCPGSGWCRGRHEQAGCLPPLSPCRPARSASRHDWLVLRQRSDGRRYATRWRRKPLPRNPSRTQVGVLQALVASMHVSGSLSMAVLSPRSVGSTHGNVRRWCGRIR